MLMFDAIVPVATVGAAVGAAAGNVAAGAGGAGTTRFSVDPDQAQNMIKGLKDAVEKLQELRKHGDLLTQAGAPGPDPYSGMATLAMRKTAGTEAGGYSWANDKAVAALEKTIENIEKALAEYRGTDEAAKNAVKG
ncbi:hypothetical protein [Lentzea flava]|uniref:PE family protein n=1 Tax=Lentzea flava TaxID=103732 RepID=A0ABQ2UMG2_9PSEU|nr:hypothetical protein [Lentzea flava]MCP2200429.1 hypothetical protein [Lentzea flava]GGU42646.1 hypothetical protein GCM10010178_39050 [Lentzea flava]